MGQIFPCDPFFYLFTPSYEVRAIMHTLSCNHARHLRLRAQGLYPTESPTFVNVGQIVRHLCGVQAQEPFAAQLALWLRSSGLVVSQVEQARVQERSIVRTWCMRGTLHLLSTEDVGWLLPHFGPVFVRKSGRRYRQLGLQEDIRTSRRVIESILSTQSPLTRAELALELAARGIPTQGQAAYYLMRHAALEGLICFGADRQGEPTYVLLKDWTQTSDAKTKDAARADLARRYLEAYAPAGPKDLSKWSGLPIKEPRAAFQMIADELLEVDIAGTPSWILKKNAALLNEPLPEQVLLHLLPYFDPYLLGYHKRDLIVPPQHAKRINRGGGYIRPTLLVNGYAAGTWKPKRSKGSLVVMVEPFKELPADVKSALDEQVRDLGRFLGVNVSWRVGER
jgi:hypothetical protein